MSKSNTLSQEQEQERMEDLDFKYREPREATHCETGGCDDPDCEKCNIVCQICKDTGFIEIMGDGDNFEVDVVATKRCGCQDD